MRRVFGRVALALPVLLGGCADISTALNPPYVPEPIHVYSEAQYEADNRECAKAGGDYKPKFSFGTVASKAFDGATADTSLIPVTPMVMAYGAAGGAASAASDGLDIMSGQHANVYRNCLHDETQIDRSAVIANPRN